MNTLPEEIVMSIAEHLDPWSIASLYASSKMFGHLKDVGRTKHENKIDEMTDLIKSFARVCRKVLGRDESMGEHRRVWAEMGIIEPDALWEKHDKDFSLQNKIILRYADLTNIRRSEYTYRIMDGHKLVFQISGFPMLYYNNNLHQEFVSIRRPGYVGDSDIEFIINDINNIDVLSESTRPKDVPRMSREELAMSKRASGDDEWILTVVKSRKRAEAMRHNRKLKLKDDSKTRYVFRLLEEVLRRQTDG